MKRNNPAQFGVVVIGDELLIGKRRDKHLSHVIDTLAARGMQVAWARLVSDNRKRLVQELKLTQQDDIPVLCFGGIGATPDDQTRQACAEAFGVRLVRNPEAVAMIENRFGDTAYPNRILMADLPEDCLLIPNAYNQIPGFTLYEHHFFPGFPVMAWPMLKWVLDCYYPSGCAPQHENSVRVKGVRESDLVELMNDLSASHPDVSLFSLPHLAEVNWIEIGFRGERMAIESAMSDLVSRLSNRELDFRFLDSGPKTAGFNRAVV